MTKKLSAAQIDVLTAYRDNTMHNRSTRVTGVLLDKGLLEAIPNDRMRGLQISDAGRAAIAHIPQPAAPKEIYQCDAHNRAPLDVAQEFARTYFIGETREIDSQHVKGDVFEFTLVDGVATYTVHYREGVKLVSPSVYVIMRHDTPAPVEVKPAPVITYRELTSDQPSSNSKYPNHSGKYLYCENCVERFMSPQNQCYCGNCYAEWEFQNTITAKPAATTSPALVETGERVIAVKPMELPTEFIIAGNKHLRVTTHHAGNGAIWTIETLESFSGTWDAQPHGYANREQLNNAIARITRESAPALTVKPATYSPCALTLQWQTLPLLPAPRQPEAPARPAAIEETYRAHTLYAEAYGNARDGYLWRLKIRGPMCGGLVMSGYKSSADALKMGRTYVSDKYTHQARKGMRGL